MAPGSGDGGVDFSIIVPHSPGRGEGFRRSLSALDYPAGRYEVLVRTGAGPSRLRNEAVAASRGEWLAFTDDDCEVPPDWLLAARAAIGRLGADIVGGPDLTRPDAPLLGRLVGLALGSPFSSWRMSARYRPVPEAVGVDEKVLTSANVFVRRSVLERVGGFDERLFPNEETEMFARAKDAGVVMAYTPELRVRHRRAGSLAAFCLQFFRSGRGRVRQGRVRGRRPEAVYFLPLLLLVYLGSLPVLLLAKAPQAVSLPAAAYALAAVATAAAAAVEHREPAAALALPVLFLALHLSYAAGTLAGLLEWALGGWPGNPF